MEHFPFLNHNPLNIFYGSKTPFGLYARQKWLKQEETKSWKKDFRETVASLFSGQRLNGSWNNSLLTTFHRLFGLHLTMRKNNGRIDKSIEWLLSQEFIEKIEIRTRLVEKVSARDLENFPFSPGSFAHLALCAILFLSTIFGKEKDPRVISGYEILRLQGEGKRNRSTLADLHNSIRALVVHPKYAQWGALQFFLARVGETQKADGTWPKEIPFYQMVNALGHLNTKQSDELLQRAWPRVREKQNSDGSWGGEQKEWNTFLVFHALKRKRPLLRT